MSSTRDQFGPSVPPEWRQAGQRYFSRSFFYRRKFGEKVWKISLDGGFSCPNRDGTVGTGGCIFCDPASFSPSRRSEGASITAQLQQAIERLGTRHRVRRFVAYFQPGTNTYGPIEQLRRSYEEALAQPAVVGLAVGTRPDCAGDEVLDLLAGLSRRTWLTVEFGLQTIHDRTLVWMNRGHRYQDFLGAVRRGQARRLEVGVHVILGLPGESPADMVATARELARCGVQAVKIHNLHAVHGTRLADEVAAGRVRLPELAEYAGWVVDFLEQLPPGCVIDRLSGDAPPQYLVGPSWCLDKATVRQAIEAELGRRDTWQGRRFKAADLPDDRRHVYP